MMSRYVSTIFVGTALLVIPIRVLAEVPEGYPTPRVMGMGGAFTAVSNDEAAFWTNPAGIARVRKARSREGVHILKFPNVTVGLNSASRGFYSALSSSTNSGVADVISSSSIDTSKPFYARAAAFPVVLFDMGKNQPAGIGTFDNSTMRIYIDRNTPTDARVSAVTDVGASVGYAFTNFSNRLNMGLNIRPTYRYAYEDTVATSDLKSKTALLTRIKKDSNRGTGIGADFGMMFTFADFWFPTLGLAVRNLPTGCKDDYLNPYTETRQKICGTVYSGSSGNPEALSVIDPMDMRLGLSISPRLGHDFGIRFSADVQNLYLSSGKTYYGLPGIDVAKLLHGGVELFTGNPLERSAFAIQVGASQGFVTFGASLNTAYMTLEFASYAADVSYTSTPMEDRRYLATASFML